MERFNNFFQFFRVICLPALLNEFEKIAEIKELEESEVCKIIKKEWGDL